ncbi:MAG TPA: zinc-binding dehydrogenase [Chloroflexota bacterium]|jgi:Zn-dependent alcohol dehydrogenase
MKTRAAVYVEIGKPMVIEEVELPDPGPTQLQVKLFASGICHTQLHTLHNPEAKVPTLLGHEATAVVMASGARVRGIREGDHVMLSFMPRPLPGGVRPELPAVKVRGQELRVSGASSTWSDDVVVDQAFVVPMDPHVPTDVTAVIGCAVTTGCGAVINTARVRPGDSVVVFGAGGVGLCAIQAAANVSAGPIIAVDVTEEKLEFARSFGATHGINGRLGSAVQQILEITSGGADFAFDAIGRPETIAQLLPSVRPAIPGWKPEGGTAVQVGVPRQQVSIGVLGDILPGGKVYRGTYGGSPNPERDYPMYVRWFMSGKLPLDRLVSRRFKLEQINEACEALERGEILGRAIVEMV